MEPGNRPCRRSPLNYSVYNHYIRSPSNGILALGDILKGEFDDVLCYSEPISKIMWRDVLDAGLIFISIFTLNARRGYGLAGCVRKHSTARIMLGGLQKKD